MCVFIRRSRIRPLLHTFARSLAHTFARSRRFSPGNLRVPFDNPEYKKLIDHYVEDKYTLRYTVGVDLDRRAPVHCAPSHSLTHATRFARSPGRNGAGRLPDHRQGEG